MRKIAVTEVDKLGRVIIPSEAIIQFNIQNEDIFEVYINDDLIILKKKINIDK